jgi:tetratricopeptide (TPR) repeat protein
MKSLARHFALALAVMLAAALALGCATTKASGSTTTKAALRGMVYNEERMPVQDVAIAFMDHDKERATTKTDVHGRFVLPDVPFGKVTIKLTKESFEALSWSFSFESPTQIVYAKMIDLSELLDDSADAIQKRDWATTKACLDRAMKIEPDNVIAQYLDAQMLSRQGNVERAVEILEKLSSGDTPSFAVEITLGDLYQYSLGKPEKALEHLKKALTVKDDLDVENRVDDLEKK